MSRGSNTIRFLLIFLVGGLSRLEAQVGEWVELESSPFVARHNDASFVSAGTGWIVNGEGEIYRTEDGGDSWRLMLESPTTHFRSVGFVDEQVGWAGSVGLGEFDNTDPVVLRETRDGGMTWTPVEDFEGPDPVGLCGMQIVNDSTVVAVGRVRGPAFFIKTNDAGASWTSMNLDSLAAGLIDVRFFDPDTGYAVGLTNDAHEESSGVILSTTDGGATWSHRFTTRRTGEWFWKISFPSRNVGYVSLQRNTRSPIYFARTGDGGLTWEEKIFSEEYYFVQGIGFLTEDVGWVGGNSSRPTFETRDGGETWRSARFGSRVNRFRFLGDTLGYAVGRKVYRYDTVSAVRIAGAERPSEPLPAEAFPNPFAASTAITLTLERPASVELAVSDVLGRRVRSLGVDKTLPAGRHSVIWDGRDAAGRNVPNGLYLYTVRIDRLKISKTLLRVR